MASSSLNADAAAIQDRLKSIHQLVKQIGEERSRSEHNLNNINKTHDRIKGENKLSPYYKTKLRGLYNTAISDAQQEADLLRKALEKIYDIRNIRNERRIMSRYSGNKETIRRGALMKMLLTSAQTLPLWVGQGNDTPPPLCGAVPPDSNYIAKMGDMVAALVKSTDGDENWILAEVVSYHPTTNKFEVDDIDEEQKERHILSRRKVIPLPVMRANRATDPDALYPKGSVVMALYPQTTCFYKGVVKELPSSGAGEYEVLFEDPSYVDGYSPPLCVPQRYVISYRKSKG